MNPENIIKKIQEKFSGHETVEQIQEREQAASEEAKIKYIKHEIAREELINKRKETEETRKLAAIEEDFQKKLREIKDKVYQETEGALQERLKNVQLALDTALLYVHKNSRSIHRNKLEMIDELEGSLELANRDFPETLEGQTELREFEELLSKLRMAIIMFEHDSEEDPSRKLDVLEADIAVISELTEQAASYYPNFRVFSDRFKQAKTDRYFMEEIERQKRLS